MSNPNTEQLYLDNKEAANLAALWAVRKFHWTMEEAQDHADFALALLLLEHLEEHDQTQLSLKKWLNMQIIYHLREIQRCGKHRGVPDVREHNRREQACSHLLPKWENGNLPYIPRGIEARPNRFAQMIQEAGEEGAALPVSYTHLTLPTILRV